jgi:hypothetical protein
LGLEKTMDLEMEIVGTGDKLDLETKSGVGRWVSGVRR